MAVLDLGYNTYNDDPEMDPWGLPIGYGDVSEQDLSNYYQQLIPQPVDYGEFDWEPFDYINQGGWAPQDENGFDLPQDQYLDWYNNNPDAQQYIDDFWNGGNGDLSQPPVTEPPPTTPPVTGGDGGYQQPWTPGPSGTTGYGPGANWPAMTTAEPLQMAEQDRMLAGAWGDLLDTSFRDQQNQYQTYEDQARQQAWSGPGGYANILAGNGGFSPEEQSNILQRDMLMGGMAGDADYAANFMTPEEIAAISGNPYAARDMAAGKLAYLDDWMRQGTQAQRDAISALDTDLRASVDPTKLGLSDEYNADYRFGGQDAQNYAEQTARMIGLRGQAERDALMRSAAAAGNTSPGAIAAAGTRNKLLSDISAGDAYSDALLKGKEMQLGVAANRENTRLGTERDISGRLRDNASEIRQTQYGMEKDNSAAWNDYGRYNTNLMVDTTGQAESAASNRAGQLATNRQNANQQNINTRFGQAGTASSALSGRYGQIAGQKKQEEAEGRGFLTGQQDRAQAGGQNAAGNRLNLYGQRMGAQGAATSRAIQAKNLPTFIDKAAGFAGGLLGG